MYRSVCCLFIIVGVCCAEEFPPVLVQEQQTEVEVSLVVHAEAAKSAQLRSTVHWQPVEFVIENGSEVEEGDLVIQFDGSDLEKQLSERKLDQRTDELKLNEQLMRIENESAALQDRIANQKSLLKVKQARLQKLQSYPDPMDVRLADGRLRVAKLEFEENEIDYQRGKRRLEQEFISPVAFARIEANRNRAFARLEHAKKTREIIDDLSSIC